MNTIVVNNEYRRELLIIILKVLALDLADSVKNPPFRVQKEISLYICKYKSKFLVLNS